MAELNQQFDPYIGTRQIPGQVETEYFNKQTNTGFSNPQQLFDYATSIAGKPVTSFDQLAPLKVEAPKEIPAATLEKPVSRLDLDRVLTENDKIRQQLLGSLGPTQEETNLQRQLFELQNADRATSLSALAGIQKAEDKVIPMEYITGQQASIQRQANLALQTNAFRQQPILQNLQLLQQNRQATLDKLNAQMQFGQADMNLAMQLREIQRQEQEAAKNFAVQYNVKAPAYTPDGKTVYATSDGKALTEQEFFTRFGFKSWDEVPKGFVQSEFKTREEIASERTYNLQREQFGFEKDKFSQNLAWEKTKFGQEIALKRAELSQKLIEAQGMGGLTKDQRTELNRIQDNVRQDPDIKNFIEIRDGYERVQTGANLKNAQGDLALLFGYMKMLDPNSVVRETEFANAESAMGYAQKILNAPSKFFKGNRLTDEGRKFFAGAANKLYATKETQHNRAVDFYSNQLDTFGIPTNLGIRDFSTSFQDTKPTTPFTGPINPNNPVYKELKGQFPKASDAEIRAALGQPTGTLSQKYESGGNPGAIGKDSTGGWSYGVYQLAHSNASRFLQSFPMYGTLFKGLKLGSQAFNLKWKEVAAKDPQGFANAQHEYIKQTHYDPQVQKLSKAGFDVSRYSSVLKDVIWSTAVQHGPATSVILNALKRVGKSASESELIKAIYNERWGGGSQFASSTSKVKQSVFNRFFGKGGELQTALTRLKSFFS